MNVRPNMWKVVGAGKDRDTDMPEPAVVDGEGRYIATLYDLDHDETWATADANARLVAAAPDLLHAAEQVLGTLEWAQENVPGTNLKSDIILLRRAAQLARGES